MYILLATITYLDDWQLTFVYDVLTAPMVRVTLDFTMGQVNLQVNLVD